MGCVRALHGLISLVSSKAAGEFPPTASRRSWELCKKLSFPLQSLRFRWEVWMGKRNQRVVKEAVVL